MLKLARASLILKGGGQGLRGWRHKQGLAYKPCKRSGWSGQQGRQRGRLLKLEPSPYRQRLLHQRRVRALVSWRTHKELAALCQTISIQSSDWAGTDLLPKAVR